MKLMIVAGEEELGPQKQCPRCSEWLPISCEFFYRRSNPRHPSDRWASSCRACCLEARRVTRERKAKRKAQDAARYLRRKAADPEGLAARSRATSKAFYWRNADLERQRERDARAAKAAAEGRTIRLGFGRPRIAA